MGNNSPDNSLMKGSGGLMRVIHSGEIRKAAYVKYRLSSKDAFAVFKHI